jgi:hypothetical protein
MNRFSLQFNNYPNTNNVSLPAINKLNYFNKDMNYYICSIGGSGSTILFNYLANFGNVYHIHDRYPPNKLQYIGKENTNVDVYSEWFNGVEIPEGKLKNYKVIFIYRNPIQVIFSRFIGPNIPHLQHIKCINNGNISLSDVLITGKDLYGIEYFFDNYITQADRNYDIYSVKYELFWENIKLFNETLGIPDIKKLYPIKQERKKTFTNTKELSYIYNSLINKMRRMGFIDLISPIHIIENEEEMNS